MFGTAWNTMERIGTHTFCRETVLAALKRSRRRVWIGSISKDLAVPPMFYPTRTLMKQIGTIGNAETQPRNE